MCVQKRIRLQIIGTLLCSSIKLPISAAASCDRDWESPPLLFAYGVRHQFIKATTNGTHGRIEPRDNADDDADGASPISHLVLSVRSCRLVRAPNKEVSSGGKIKIITFVRSCCLVSAPKRGKTQTTLAACMFACKKLQFVRVGKTVQVCGKL